MSTALLLPHDIGPGPDREIQILLADRWPKLVLIQLRRGALLAVPGPGVTSMLTISS
jgi:hypothetical protein